MESNLLHKMRMQVLYTDKVEMPIPLYEEIKKELGIRADSANKLRELLQITNGRLLTTTKNYYDTDLHKEIEVILTEK